MNSGIESSFAPKYSDTSKAIITGSVATRPWAMSAPWNSNAVRDGWHNASASRHHASPSTRRRQPSTGKTCPHPETGVWTRPCIHGNQATSRALGPGTTQVPPSRWRAAILASLFRLVQTTLNRCPFLRGKISCRTNENADPPANTDLP